MIIIGFGAGNFCLDAHKKSPAVLTAAGDRYTDFEQLSGGNRSTGALVDAGAAIYAGIGVDDVFAFSLRDRLDRADIDAGTAGNTIISDNVSHSFLLLDTLLKGDKLD